MSLRFWTVLLGVVQITVGCLVGLIPPPAVQWFRGLVMAHIEFTVNGVLMIAFALLVRELGLGAKGLKTWFVALQVGTWTNGLAGLVGAFLGSSSKLLPTLNSKFPAPNGIDNAAVTALLVLCVPAILIALVLTLVGLVRGRSQAETATNPVDVSHLVDVKS